MARRADRPGAVLHRAGRARRSPTSTAATARWPARRSLDLGCGPGFYTRAFRAAGADVLPVDNSTAELALAGDAARRARSSPTPATLPFEDGVDRRRLLLEPARAHAEHARGDRARSSASCGPAAGATSAWTNWYSPWGGHDMSPYHYLGPERGPRLYERRHGPPRKNPYGDGLWAVHIGPTLRLVRARPGLEIERVEPRYWPRLAFITRVPGLREVATWNCVIRVRKR